MTRKKQAKYFYLFILPRIIGFTIFTIYPMVSSLYFSLIKYDVISSPEFVGLENYKVNELANVNNGTEKAEDVCPDIAQKLDALLQEIKGE